MSHQHKFVTLDALRGIAALFILTRHTSSYWGGVSFPHSYLAVDLFFMLSGFVISHAYDRKLTSKTMTLGSFFITRLIRLYPLYLLALFISALVYFPRKAFIHGDINLIIEYGTSLFFSLFYLPYKVASSNLLFTLNPVSWSLFFELFINIIYAVSRPFLSNRILVLVLVTSGLYLLAQCFSVGSLDYGYIWDWQSISIGSARTIYGFVCGLLLHRLFLKQPTNSTSTIRSFLLLLLASILLGIQNLDSFNELVDGLSLIIVFPICVFLGAKTTPKNRVADIFKSLGIISYPIYLLHSSLGAGISKASILIGFKISSFAPYSGLLLVLGLFCISLILDRFYDTPLRRYLSTIVFNKPRTPNRTVDLN